METPEGSGKSPHGLNNGKPDKTIAHIHWKETLQRGDVQFTIPREHSTAITNNILKMHFLTQRFGRAVADGEAVSFVWGISPCKAGGEEGRGAGDALPTPARSASALCFPARPGSHPGCPRPPEEACFLHFLKESINPGPAPSRGQLLPLKWLGRVISPPAFSGSRFPCNGFWALTGFRLCLGRQDEAP